MDTSETNQIRITTTDTTEIDDGVSQRSAESGATRNLPITTPGRTEQDETDVLLFENSDNERTPTTPVDLEALEESSLFDSSDPMQHVASSLTQDDFPTREKSSLKSSLKSSYKNKLFGAVGGRKSDAESNMMTSLKQSFTKRSTSIRNSKLDTLNISPAESTRAPATNFCRFFNGAPTWIKIIMGLSFCALILALGIVIGSLSAEDSFMRSNKTNSVESNAVVAVNISTNAPTSAGTAGQTVGWKPPNSDSFVEYLASDNATVAPEIVQVPSMDKEVAFLSPIVNETEVVYVPQTKPQISDDTGFLPPGTSENITEVVEESIYEDLSKNIPSQSPFVPLPEITRPRRPVVRLPGIIRTEQPVVPLPEILPINDTINEVSVDFLSPIQEDIRVNMTEDATYEELTKPLPTASGPQEVNTSISEDLSAPDVSPTYKELTKVLPPPPVPSNETVEANIDVDYLSPIYDNVTDVAPSYKELTKPLPPTPAISNETVEVNSDLDYLSPIYENVTNDISSTWKDLTKPLPPTSVPSNGTVEVNNDVDYLSPIFENATAPTYKELTKTIPSPAPTNETVAIKDDVDYLSPIYENVTSDVSPTWKDLTKPLEPLPVPVNETVDIKDDVDYLSPIYENVTNDISPTWKDLTKPVPTPVVTNETVDVNTDVDYLSPIYENVTNGVVSPTYKELTKPLLIPTPVPSNETVDVNSDVDYLSPIYDNITDVTPTWSGLKKTPLPTPVPSNETIDVNSDVDYLSPILENTTAVSPTWSGLKKTPSPTAIPVNETIDVNEDVDYLSPIYDNETAVTPTWSGLKKTPSPTAVPVNETIDVNEDVDYLSPIYDNETAVTPTWSGLKKTSSPTAVPVNETIDVNEDVDYLSPIYDNTTNVAPTWSGLKKTEFPTSAPSLSPSLPPPSYYTYEPTSSYSSPPSEVLEVSALTPPRNKDFAALSPENSNALTFTTTGGYYESDIDFYTTLKSLGAQKYEFFVYLGNFMPPSEAGTCEESQYESFSNTMKSYTTIPVLAIPGVKDWKNCDDPSKSLQTWRKYFTTSFDRYWFPEPSVIERRPGKMEDFSYLYEDVLYISVRHEETNVDDISWIRAQTLKHKDRFRILIIIGDSPYSEETKPFFQDLSNLITTIATPTVYMHSSDQTAVYNNFLNHIILVQVHESKNPFMKVHLYDSSITFQQ